MGVSCDGVTLTREGFGGPDEVCEFDLSTRVGRLAYVKTVGDTSGFMVDVSSEKYIVDPRTEEIVSVSKFIMHDEPYRAPPEPVRDAIPNDGW